MTYYTQDSLLKENNRMWIIVKSTMHNTLHTVTLFDIKTLICQAFARFDKTSKVQSERFFESQL